MPQDEFPRLPAPAVATLQRRGFQPASTLQLDKPRSTWWCVRPVRVPAGRIASTVGWYHEWIATPEREVGADFYGSDSVRGGWPSSPLSFFRPLYVIQHKGACRGEDVWCRPIEGVDYDRLQMLLETGKPSGRLLFPIHNCNTWVRKTLRDARKSKTE